ncbi:hypothetical protein EDD17DRAFT_1640632 [Pisolithus thermaeus]|nr:hypothetical protein EDD17DRAFT_1640632 [Pisolithus thermaeus]
MSHVSRFVHHVWLYCIILSLYINSVLYSWHYPDGAVVLSLLQEGSLHGFRSLCGYGAIVLPTSSLNVDSPPRPIVILSRRQFRSSGSRQLVVSPAVPVTEPETTWVHAAAR